MPQHEKSARRIIQQLHDWVPPIGHPDRYRAADRILDNYLDAEQRASEWDADQWGLPDSETHLLHPHAAIPNEVAPSSDGWRSALLHLQRLAPRGRDGHPEFWPEEPAKWDIPDLPKDCS